MKRSKKDLIKTLETGKMPGRRNLFKLLFSLAGIPMHRYGGVVYSDGYNDEGKRSRIVLKCSISHIDKSHLSKMQEYVTDLKMKRNVNPGLTTFSYHLRDVDWNRIDEHTKNRN